ncbi:MAG TPA: tetratricopeptide repeat protein [Myxococcota bacterium]|nr:tetratricopeptide repeat protein [Myxococcota bacterium]
MRPSLRAPCRSRAVGDPLRCALVAAIALLASALGCASNARDPSAGVPDAASRWQAEFDRATRLHRQRRFDAAADAYARALTAARAFERGDARTAQTHAQRAELQLSLGEYVAAERDYRAAIGELRAARGADGAALADALNSLAVFCIDLERISEAEALLVEAIEIRSRLYGADHAYVAVLLQNLGDAERRAANFTAAEPLLRRALAIHARSGREFAREAAIAQNNLALLLAATGREHDAEIGHFDAIRLASRLDGHSSTDVGVFARDLAALYTRQGRFAEADSLYRDSIAIFRSELGEASHQLAKSYRAYGSMLRAAGRGAEAIEYERRADATGF